MKKKMVVETLISLGMLGIMIYIATKVAVINHNSDMIVDMLMRRRPPPPSSSYDAKKHSECYPSM